MNHTIIEEEDPLISQTVEFKQKLIVSSDHDLQELIGMWYPIAEYSPLLSLRTRFMPSSVNRIKKAFETSTKILGKIRRTGTTTMTYDSFIRRCFELLPTQRISKIKSAYLCSTLLSPEAKKNLLDENREQASFDDKNESWSNIVVLMQGLLQHKLGICDGNLIADLCHVNCGLDIEGIEFRHIHKEKSAVR